MTKCWKYFKTLLNIQDTEGISEQQILEEKYVAEFTFCISAFAPECVRYMARKSRRTGSSSGKFPLSVKSQSIFLTCETPAIPELIDHYSMSNDFSVVEIAGELNKHVTGVIRRLVNQGGDVLYFFNDTLTCVWSAEHEKLSNVTQRVLRVALEIQKKFQTKTKLGYKLRNNIGISIGEFDMFYVGKEKVFYVAMGDALKESRCAASKCWKNSVVVTESFWNRINQKDSCKWQTMDEKHIMVYSCEEPCVLIENIEKDKQESLELYNQEFGPYLVSFLQHIVDESREEQLQVVSSLSQVVATAVRVKGLDLKTPEALHEVTEKVEKIVIEKNGVILKVLCDTFITFFILFGYPGFKRRDDAVNAILCAQEIVKFMKEMKLQICVGISCGNAFFGAVGPNVRQESVVLGMPVQTVFRIVRHFSEMEIVCCINTFFRTCRILGNIFTPLRRRLKISKIATIVYQVHTETKRPSPTVDLIGRTKEKELVTNTLKELREGLEKSSKLPIIAITGEIGMGKTVFLNWVLKEAPNLGFKYIARVSNISLEEPFENVWCVVKQVLSSASIKTESQILELLGDDAEKYPLHLLNTRMDVSFSCGSDTIEPKYMRNMLTTLLKEPVQDGPILIGIDDVDLTGIDSWLILQEVLSTRDAIVVSTYCKDFCSESPLIEGIFKKQYLNLQLSPLQTRELCILTCEILNVRAIHKSILEFLQKQSRGNAVYLQEIVMLPNLQKHFCIASFESVTENTLQNNFEVYEGDEAKFVSLPSKVCDILDEEGLWNVTVPGDLWDMVKNHTAVLNPEEQMLVRKCSLLGDTFSFFVLEAVSQEYPTTELLHKIEALISKRFLDFECNHLEVKEEGVVKLISFNDHSMDLCTHPMKLCSKYLRKCIVSSITECQRERMNLYLAHLLQDTFRNCESCEQEYEEERSFSRQGNLKDFKLPSIDFRLCQCMNLRTQFLVQAEFHLDKGNADVHQRMTVLLNAADSSLEANNAEMVEEIKTKLHILLPSAEDETGRTPNYVNIAVKRLKAEVMFRDGKVDEALRYLSDAMKIMNILFPDDIKKRNYVKKRYEGSLGLEERKCLFLGCLILKAHERTELAYKVGKLLQKILSKTKFGFLEIVLAKRLLLSLASKRQPGRKRESEIRGLINEIRKECFRRLSVYPVLDSYEVEVVIYAFRTVVHILFEKAELSAAEELGKISLRILKVVKHQTELAHTLFLLLHIYFYQDKNEKCCEMVSHLQDASEQSTDTISEVFFYTALTQVLRHPQTAGSDKDMVKLCANYAEKSAVIPFHPKNKYRVFCLFAKMALWCKENNLKEAFPIWYQEASILQIELQLNGYLALSGSICLLIIDILKGKENTSFFTSREMSSFKQKISKKLRNIQKQVRVFVPVLESDVKEVEEMFKNISGY